MATFQVGTYNIRADFEIDGNWSWAYRKEGVKDLLMYHDCDIIGIQEIKPHQYSYLASMETYDSIYQEREGDGLGEGIGIFYKKDRFTLIETHYFWLSETPDKPSIHPEAGCKRIAVWGMFVDKESEQTFLMINTHLDHVSEAARYLGVEVLLGRLGDKIVNYPTILVGDFNAEPKESLHQLLRPTFDYTGEETSTLTYGPSGTFQEFDHERTWEDLVQIDYILTKGFRCHTKAVLTDSYLGKYPSDHFPVVAKLDWEKK